MAPGAPGRVERPRYLVVSKSAAGVLTYDVTDRSSPRLFGWARLPGDARHVSVDALLRRLYVSGGEGLTVVDFDQVPKLVPVDSNFDGAWPA